MEVFTQIVCPFVGFPYTSNKVYTIIKTLLPSAGTVGGSPGGETTWVIENGTPFVSAVIHSSWSGILSYPSIKMLFSPIREVNLIFTDVIPLASRVRKIFCPPASLKPQSSGAGPVT